MLRHNRHERIHDRRAVFRQMLVLLFSAGMTAYFSYHAIYGRHGLVARNQLFEQEQLLEFETRSIEAVRDGLRHDVALLSPEMPDADFVEELSREMLGFVHPQDRVISLKH